MDLRRGRRTGVTLSLQEPLEADGQLTLVDTLPDEADMEAGCESRAEVDRLTERLRADGHPVLSEPRTTGDGYYESAVGDPDGNLVELVYKA